MAYPSNEKIVEMLKRLEKADGTLVIDRENASASDLLKYDLCQQFIKYLMKKKISQMALAEELGIDRAIVNKIILRKIEYFSADRLIDLLSKIKPVTIKLA